MDITLPALLAGVVLAGICELFVAWRLGHRWADLARRADELNEVDRRQRAKERYMAMDEVRIQDRLADVQDREGRLRQWIAEAEQRASAAAQPAEASAPAAAGAPAEPEKVR